MPQIDRKELKELFSIGKKRCVKCLDIKSLDDFHNCKNNTTTGRASMCKLCMSWYAHEYKKTERGQEVNKRASKKYFDTQYDWHTRDRQRVRARDAVITAVKRHKMRPAKDFECIYKSSDCTGFMYYHHHNGYEREHWLDVVPVCSFHHTNLDKRQGLYRKAPPS